MGHNLNQRKNMPQKILVVDDDDKSARLVQRRLAAMGHEVILASDGAQGVQKAFAEMPDLIILDLTMPVMDGYQACRLLKGSEHTAHIPILMLTARARKSDKYWGIRTGADDYLIKPISHRELAARVEALLTNSRVDREASGQHDKNDEAVDKWEVVSRASKLLDTELYEATIANELSKVAKFIGDDASLAKSILLLLSKVVDFDTAGIFVLHTRTLTIYGKTNDTLAEGFATRLLAELGKQGLEMERANIELEIIPTFWGIGPDEKGGNDRRTFETVLLQTMGNTMGVVMLERAPGDGSPEADRRILELISDQAALIIDNARLYAEVRKSSITDGLTGAFNHRYFYACLDEEYSKARRHNRPLALLMVDIDHFKRVNDAYGHLQGDAVLTELAGMLMDSIREGNVVARYGGEEFVLLLPETDEEGALTLAERLRGLVENHRFTCDKGELRLTISLGVATLSDDIR